MLNIWRNVGIEQWNDESWLLNNNNNNKTHSLQKLASFAYISATPVELSERCGLRISLITFSCIQNKMMSFLRSVQLKKNGCIRKTDSHRRFRPEFDRFLVLFSIINYFAWVRSQKKKSSFCVICVCCCWVEKALLLFRAVQWCLTTVGIHQQIVLVECVIIWHCCFFFFSLTSLSDFFFCLTAASHSLLPSTYNFQTKCVCTRDIFVPCSTYA